MILPNLKLTSYANQHLRYSGRDRLSDCVNKEHFLNYPYAVRYQYNSRGYRGSEWPSDLSNSCWCVGDSFTSGVGAPLEHTWHYILSDKLKINTINVSMDGASNEWITRKVLDILEIQPKNIIIQWSYTHRREDSDSNLPDEKRKIHSINVTDEEDIEHTIQLIKLVEANKQKTNIIHTFVPECVPVIQKESFKQLLNQLNINVVYFDQIDYARDYHHYDIKTSTSLVENLINSKYINI